jgi:uncharacterized damage-inducible protein DinB
MTTTAEVINKEQLLRHWQGHRFVTRRVIEAFPEKEFFEFTIGGMRPFSGMVSELLSIGVPALKSIVAGKNNPYTEEGFGLTSKAQFLQKWDEHTEQINSLWAQIPEEDFEKTFNLFGQYEFPIYQNILYFVDNEIHHRGQGFVYLRALGIIPPFFWERW